LYDEKSIEEKINEKFDLSRRDLELKETIHSILSSVSED
jgi:hypothetical protein